MKRQYQIQMQQAYVVLKSLKEDNNQDAFKKKFMELLPTIKQYIKNRIETASKKQLLKNEGYSVDDFVNELYIYVYENIDKLDHQDDFQIWLFQAIDKLIEDTLVEEEFDNYFFKNIDDYGKQEWEAMEEEFTMDADGDLVMFEELDDTSLSKDNYELKDIFIEDNEKELTAKLEKELSQERINTHANMVMNKLPLATQSVFDLHTFRGFGTDDIANIKQLQVDVVDGMLKEAQDVLKTSFKNRFLS